MAFTFVENALNLFIFTHASVPTQVSAQFSVPRQNVLKICFPQAKRSAENDDSLYQNLIRKYEDDLEH